MHVSYLSKNFKKNFNLYRLEIVKIHTVSIKIQLRIFKFEKRKFLWFPPTEYPTRKGNIKNKWRLRIVWRVSSSPTSSAPAILNSYRLQIGKQFLFFFILARCGIINYLGTLWRCKKEEIYIKFVSEGCSHRVVFIKEE